MRRLARRLLGDQRIVVLLGVLAAVAVGAFVIIGLPKHSGPPDANAEAEVLLDTNHSQLVTAASKEVMNSSLRATLVGDLVASDQATSLLARDAHIEPSELTVIAPSSMAPPAFLTPLVSKAAPFATAATTPYVLILNNDAATAPNAETGPMPIITIETQAPDQTGATTLVDAAISALKSVLGPQSASQPDGFVVRMVSPARIVVIPHRSRRPMYAVIGGVVIFVLWYSAAFLAPRIASRRRRPQLA